MANIPPIQFKRSHIKTVIPAPSQLAVGEIAINFADGYIFSKDSDGNVIRMGGGTGGLLAVDSENVLYGLDSDSVKHKEAVIFDIALRRLLTWDSELDAFKQIGGAGGGNTVESIYQDFEVTQVNRPVFTITNPELNDVVSDEEFYVLYGGFPLPTHAFTVLGSKGSWRIRLDSAVDYTGSMYEIGDWIRVGKGNSLKIYDTSIGTTITTNVDPSAFRIVTATANVTQAIYDSEDLWVDNTQVITGVVRGDEMSITSKIPDSNIYWFDNSSQPFKVTTDITFSENGFKYKVREISGAKVINDSDHNKVQGNIWSYYKIDESATYPFVDSEVNIDSVSFAQLQNTMDYFKRNEEDFYSDLNNLGSYVANYSNGSGFRFLDGQWQHDTINYNVNTNDSDLIILHGLDGIFIRQLGAPTYGRLQVVSSNEKSAVILYRTLTASSTSNWATSIVSGRKDFKSNAGGLDLTQPYTSPSGAFNGYSEFRIADTIDDMSLGRYKSYQVWSHLQSSSVSGEVNIWIRRLK